MQINKASKNIIEFIKKHEAPKGRPILEAYEFIVDKATGKTDGKFTIGYGHTWNIKRGDKITLEQAELLLQEDIEQCEEYLNNTCRNAQVKLKQNQFDALISFLFNLGTFNTAMLKRFQNKDLSAIGNSLLLYTKSNGIELKGLKLRREGEHRIYFS